MKKLLTLLLLFPLFHSDIQAQPSSVWDAAMIKLKMEKLDVLGSVLYVAAHPDDENSQLLGFLSNGKKYRTGYLSLTRGSGGQNLIGDEQSPYIGLIRTEELLAARRADGAEQFFSRAFDFGFSKNADETLRFWGHNRILSDVVWVIRKFRPDVIITRFPEDKRAGHGNHWASAILAHEAYKAAADPSKFPDQLKYVKPWQAKRLLWNTYRFGDVINTTSEDQFRIDDGGFNPLMGKSYGEIAADSRSMHKSQGYGSAPTFGHHAEYFVTTEGPAPQETLLDGVNTTWSGVEGGKGIEEMIRQLNEQFKPDHPEESVAQLVRIKRAIESIKDPYWEVQKIKEIDDLIYNCLALHVGIYAEEPYVVPGASINVQAEAIKMSEIPVTVQSVNIMGAGDQPLHIKMKDNKYEKGKLPVLIPSDTPISQPYWLVKPPAAGYYDVTNQQLIGLAKNPDPLMVRFTLLVDGEQVKIEKPLQYRFTDPVRGEIIDPLVVAPPVVADLGENLFVFSEPGSKEVKVNLEAFKDNVSGTAHLNAPEGFQIEHNDQPFSLKKYGDKKMLVFQLSPAGKITSPATGTLSVNLKVGDKIYDRGIKVIDYSHIPKITAFPPAEATVASVPLNLSPGKRIGYIMGSGDMMQESLRQIGYQVDLLSDADINKSHLKQYDAVVMGIRAYNTRKALDALNPVLLEYVKEGGVMVVQYNKPDVTLEQLGPYPFKISQGNSQRVTEEDSKVTFNLPDDQVLNTPNKITEKDFDGWVQERGLYFTDFADSRYRKPLTMNDQGESPLYGSLITTDYGKGKYVYTSLAFFRQLPAGVPGAFRLFVNLLAK